MKSAEKMYDVVVIGGGPGGYVAAIRAAQLGLKTACVEMRDTLGGTCLNIGCVPSKALLQSSEYYHMAAKDFAKHGINVQPKLDLATMMKRKNKVVVDLTSGVAFLFKKNKVDHIKGRGRISQPGQVDITEGPDKGQQIACKNIIIATGSETTPVPGLEIDEKRIVSSTGALEFPTVPKHLVVVGGGVIGLEMGSIWNRLGAAVTVVEYMPHIIPAIDRTISNKFTTSLERQGIKFKLQTKVTGVEKLKTKCNLTLVKVGEDEGGKAEVLACDAVLVAVGRRPFTEGVGVDALGIKTDARGFIEVDSQLQTNIPGIYAIGDCVPGMMLAHKAEDEGVAVAEIIAGQHGHVNYGTIPGVIYTWPEVAYVGQTEEELKAANRPYRVGKFSFKANSRSRATDMTDGLVKILADKETDRVLGGHIVGPNAGDLIHEIVTVMEFGGSAEDIARICHAHPTFSEAIKEAAMDSAGRALHA